MLYRLIKKLSHKEVIEILITPKGKKLNTGSLCFPGYLKLTANRMLGDIFRLSEE